AEAEQVVARGRRVPRIHVRRRRTDVTLPTFEPRDRVAHLPFEHERIVRFGLDAHQQAIERRDVDAGRVMTALERLDERRPRPGERIEDAPAAGDMTAEKLLDE